VQNDAQALVVMTVLTDSPETVAKAGERLENARLKNRDKNIDYMLLCDPYPINSETPTEFEYDNDEEIIKSCNILYKNKGIYSAVRKRIYSKTMKKWQGNEKKRGALLDLMCCIHKTPWQNYFTHFNLCKSENDNNFQQV
jgi:hypothetical protein